MTITTFNMHCPLVFIDFPVADNPDQFLNFNASSDFTSTFAESMVVTSLYTSHTVS